MTTFRSVHDSKNLYLVISKKAVFDTKLSDGAFRLLSYALSQPDDWRLRDFTVCRDLGISSDTYYTRLKELERLGYVVRNKTRKGSQWETRVDIYEDPSKANTIGDSIAVFSDSENPHTYKYETYKDKSTKDNELSSFTHYVRKEDNETPHQGGETASLSSLSLPSRSESQLETDSAATPQLLSKKRAKSYICNRKVGVTNVSKSPRYARCEYERGSRTSSRNLKLPMGPSGHSSVYKRRPRRSSLFRYLSRRHQWDPIGLTDYF